MGNSPQKSVFEGNEQDRVYLLNSFLSVLLTGLRNPCTWLLISPSAGNWADNFEFCSWGPLLTEEINHIIYEYYRKEQKEFTNHFVNPVLVLYQDSYSFWYRINKIKSFFEKDGHRPKYVSELCNARLC